MHKNRNNLLASLILGLITTCSVPVFAASLSNQTNQSNIVDNSSIIQQQSPAIIAQTRYRKEARRNESQSRRRYRDKRHQELQRKLDKAMLLPKNQRLSQREKERLMREEHRRLDRSLDRKWGTQQRSNRNN